MVQLRFMSKRQLLPASAAYKWHAATAALKGWTIAAAVGLPEGPAAADAAVHAQAQVCPGRELDRPLVEETTSSTIKEV